MYVREFSYYTTCSLTYTIQWRLLQNPRTKAKMYMCICAHVYIRTYAYMYICICVTIHVHMYTYVHVYICTYIHIYTYTHIHIHLEMEMGALTFQACLGFREPSFEVFDRLQTQIVSRTMQLTTSIPDILKRRLEDI